MYERTGDTGCGTGFDRTFGAASYLFGPGYTVDLPVKAIELSDLSERAAWSRAVMITVSGICRRKNYLYHGIGIEPARAWRCSNNRTNTKLLEQPQKTTQKPPTADQRVVEPLWLGGALKGRPANQVLIGRDGVEKYASDEESVDTLRECLLAEKTLVDLQQREAREDEAAEEKRKEEYLRKQRRREQEREEWKAAKKKDKELTRQQGRSGDLRAQLSSRENSRSRSQQRSKTPRNRSQSRSRSPVRDRARSPPTFGASRFAPSSTTGSKAESFYRERG
ncbi:hypothetical protein SARC_04185 [Sphaeroforma arctica JP610]|uniref:Uncharacterized protein n=1 Tax=Sphaeroforma arctica JP610 TaxID=667725 RepID=A0A0L0G431_9EUKA|nr:hypothetical protein SARC_04185 [Sphaeroforma arctica JP610]KNC83561.1 hypothetical protein SARC_04185 [Sphaeroforma arctica JP610]|eukprot:XP_014157463.1 hypothetical protein SARC_04185 [Sphaeroforma arctica JP610]